MSTRHPMIQAAASDDQNAHKPIAIEASASVEFQAAAGEGGAPARPTFTIAAYNGGMVRVGGYFRPMVVDLKGLRANRVTILRDHDMSQIVGQGTAKIEASRVTVTGQITGDIADKSDPAYGVVTHARNGFQWAASVGVLPDTIEWVESGSKAQANGQTFNGPLGIVRAGRLGEVSFVGIGADETASANIAATAANTGEPNMEKFKQWLTAMGLSYDTLTEDQRGKLQAKFDAEQTPPVQGQGSATPPPVPPVQAGGQGGEDPLQAHRQQRAAEMRRIAAIDQLQAKYRTVSELTLADGTKQPLAAFCASAIEAGTAADAVELELLRASRSPVASGPVIITASGQGPLSGPVLSAALCLSANLPDVDKAFDEPTLTAASRIGRRLGLQETIMLAAQANGWHGPVTPSAFRSSHSDILAHAFPPVRAVASSLDIAGILSNVANKFLLDSFNAVERVWSEIAARRPANDFKTMTFYRLTNAGEYEQVGPDGKLKHGTMGNESYTNRARTYGKLLTITREDQYNDDMGALTAVPSQLGGDGARKLNNVFWASFQDNADFFTAARGNYIDGAAAAWYLLASPRELPVMQVAFLDGREVPVVEQAAADFDTLGIDMRSFHDFGVARAEYRGGVKSKVALSVTSLEAAEKAFIDQKINGTDPLGIKPSLLLVASGNSVLARQIFVATELRDTTANTKAPVSNVFGGMYRPLVSGYLSNV